MNKKEENLEQNKDKETDNKINIPIKSKNIIPYRSFKRNTDHNIKEVSNKLNNLYNEKKEEEEEKEKIVEPKKEKRRRYYSNLEQDIDIPKNKLTNIILDFSFRLVEDKPLNNETFTVIQRKIYEIFLNYSALSYNVSQDCLDLFNYTYFDFQEKDKTLFLDYLQKYIIATSRSKNYFLT